MQVCLLDLHGVPEDQARYSVEHLLDGEYIKYNSNQGYAPAPLSRFVIDSEMIIPFLPTEHHFLPL